MSLLAQLDQKIAANGGLIVSCQPVPDSPLDKPEIVAAMALAAEQAGAVAIRIEGVANLQATRAVVSVPIIGIVKRDLEDSPVRITAYIEDVDALAQAGADIIAIDGTDRPRPVPVETLLARIHHHGLLAMTDCSTPEDGLACQKLGAEIIGTRRDYHLQVVDYWPGTNKEVERSRMSGDCRRALQHACSGGRCDAPRRVGGDGRFCHYAS